MDDLFEVVKARYGELCEAGYTVAFCLGGNDRFFKCSYRGVTCLEISNYSCLFMGTDHIYWISATSLNEIISSLIDTKRQSESFVESIDHDTLNTAFFEVFKLAVQTDLNIIYGHIVKSMLIAKFPTSNVKV